ncbi:MAG TPA: ferredoxin, partial [Gemmatimonadales bacterium]
VVPFHQFLELPLEERGGLTPFIYTLDGNRRLVRFAVSHEMVELAEDRLKLWHQLRQMAGLEVPDSVRETVTADVEAEYERKASALKADFERQLSDLKVRYPQVIARRLAEGLLKAGGNRTVADILADIPTAPAFELGSVLGNGHAAPAVAVAAPPAAVAPTTASPAAASPAAVAPAAGVTAEEEGLVIEPWIDSARCTSCDECTNINRKLFAYNEKKQAYIKDPKGGSFKDLVTAAERCPVSIIHPGTPLNPKEKGLDKLLVRAAKFA